MTWITGILIKFLPLAKWLLGSAFVKKLIRNQLLKGGWKMFGEKAIISFLAILLDKINDMETVRSAVKDFGKEQGKNLAETIPGDKLEVEGQEFIDLFTEGFKEGFTS